MSWLTGIFTGGITGILSGDDDKGEAIESVSSGIGNIAVHVGGTAAGALLGYGVGSNWGTLGKLGGAVIGAFAGGFTSGEIAEDIAGMIDCVNANEDCDIGIGDKIKMLFSNFINLNGQTYDASTDWSEIETEAEK